MKTRLYGHSFVGIIVVIATISLFGAEQTPEDAELNEKVQAALKAANPEYEGKGNFGIRNGKLTMIHLMGCKGITDLSPLKEFPLSSVRNLILYRTKGIKDLSPLAGCKLQQANLEGCDQITSIAPLAGMPMRSFRMCAKGISDLSPLKGMPLRHLDIGYYGQKVTDISVLEGMPLADLRLDNCPELTDISAIRDMPLTLLSLQRSRAIKDFSPLEGLTKLEKLFFTPKFLTEKEIEIVRNIKSLKSIKVSWNDNKYNSSGKGWSGIQTPEKFWERYDAGEFGKKPKSAPKTVDIPDTNKDTTVNDNADAKKKP